MYLLVPIFKNLREWTWTGPMVRSKGSWTNMKWLVPSKYEGTVRSVTEWDQEMTATCKRIIMIIIPLLLGL